MAIICCHKSILKWRHFIFIGILFNIISVECYVVPISHSNVALTLMQKVILNWFQGLWGGVIALFIGAVPKMHLVDKYNWFEVGLWGWGGIIFLGRSQTKGGYYFRHGIVTGILLLIFSMSDAMELISGAWWSPWWLFLWKVLTIIGFVFVYRWYRKTREIVTLLAHEK